MNGVQRILLGFAVLVCPPVSPAPAQDAHDAGQLFSSKCGGCHGAGAWGTRTLERRLAGGQAELTKRSGLTAEYVAYVIRHGVGSMPPFTPTDLSAEQARQLGRYLERRGSLRNRQARASER